MNLRWKRCPISKTPLEWSPRRIANAARAVQRQKADCPLFPELVTDPTPTARMARIDARQESISTRLRSFHADCWRRARRAVRSLDPQARAAFLARWNSGPYPADGCNVLTVLRMMGLPESPVE